MGEKPARSWDWRRTARELFAVYDRARLQEVYSMMDQGVALAQAGKTQEAVQHFDRVLARAPLFERREEMVPSYLAFAKQMREQDRVAAAAALRRALVLAPDGDQANAVRSEIALLEAKDLAERGVLDVRPAGPGHRTRPLQRRSSNPTKLSRSRGPNPGIIVATLRCSRRDRHTCPRSHGLRSSRSPAVDAQRLRKQRLRKRTRRRLHRPRPTRRLLGSPSSSNPEIDRNGY